MRLLTISNSMSGCYSKSLFPSFVVTVSSAFVGGNVAELVACGFSAQVAKKALELVKKNPTTASTKEAEMDHVINECLRLQGEEEAKATQLAALGFSEAKAQVALEKCNGNMEAAAEWLLENEVGWCMNDI